MPVLPKFDRTEKDMITQLRSKGHSLREIARKMDASPPTVLRSLQKANLPIVSLGIQNAETAYTAAFCAACEGPVVCDDRWHLKRMGEVLKTEAEVIKTRSGGRWQLPVVVESKETEKWESDQVRGLLDRCGTLSLQVTSLHPTPVFNARLRLPEEPRRQGPFWKWIRERGIEWWQQENEVRFSHRRAVQLCEGIYNNAELVLRRNAIVWRYAKTLLSEGFEFMSSRR